MGQEKTRYFKYHAKQNKFVEVTYGEYVRDLDWSTGDSVVATWDEPANRWKFSVRMVDSPDYAIGDLVRLVRDVQGGFVVDN